MAWYSQSRSSASMRSMLTTYINDEDRSTARELRSPDDEFTRYLETELRHVQKDCDLVETSQESENEFLTLQNVNPAAVATNPSSVPYNLYYDYPTSVGMIKESNFESDLEMLVDIADSDIEDGETKFSDTVTSYILDDKIRNSVLEVNKQIEDNLALYRRETEEVKAIIAKQQSLKRELNEIKWRISNYSVEDAKLRKIQRKKGTACAKTLSNRKTYFWRFGIPYFKTNYRYPADQNEDMKEIVKNDQIMLVRLPKMRRFLPRDAQNLDRNILDQLKLKRVESLNEGVKQLEMSKDEDSDYEQKTRNFRIAIQHAEAVTNLEDTLPWHIPIDFMALSKVNTRFAYEDCERIWNLLANPQYSRREFSEDELSRLKTLIDENGAQNWDYIASALGTNRTGFMCFTKYVSSSRKNKNSPWTKEEDELLLKLGERLSYLKKSARHDYWRNIRQRFPNRSYTAIHAHWKYVLQPNLKKGRFTTEENAKIEQLVEEGKTFSEIAEILENRSTVQLRNHYNQMINRGIIRGAWSIDEVNQLLELVQKYGVGNWASIGKEMGSRNRMQCRLKYQCVLSNTNTVSSPIATRRKWTHVEIALFKQLLLIHGPKFSTLSDAMKTRSAQECRLKYRRMRRLRQCDDMHKVEVRHGRWSASERRKFAKLVQKYDTQFTKISEEIRTRDAAQCKLKYERMLIARRRNEQKYEERLDALLHVEELKYKETMEKQSGREIECPAKEYKHCETNEGGQKKSRTKRRDGKADKEEQPEQLDETQQRVKKHKSRKSDAKQGDQKQSGAKRRRKEVDATKLLDKETCETERFEELASGKERLEEQASNPKQCEAKKRSPQHRQLVNGGASHHDRKKGGVMRCGLKKNEPERREHSYDKEHLQEPTCESKQCGTRRRRPPRRYLVNSEADQDDKEKGEAKRRDRTKKEPKRRVKQECEMVPRGELCGKKRRTRIKKN